MQDKIASTKENLKREIGAARNPVLMCSFGKDSLTILHLLRSMGINIPILFWREHGQNKKYEFADLLIHLWDLKVYDYPPSAVDIVNLGDKFDGIGFRSFGNTALVYVAIELHPPTDEMFSCAIEEILNKPTIPTFDYKWDLTLSGHKSGDIDPILGEIPLKHDKVQFGTTTVFYPLRDWTDAEVWQYIIENNVPYEKRRYDANNGFKEREDKTYNNNYHFACTACLNPGNGAKAWCRLMNKEIENIGHTIDYAGKLKIYKALSDYIDYGKREV